MGNPGFHKPHFEEHWPKGMKAVVPEQPSDFLTSLTGGVPGWHPGRYVVIGEICLRRRGVGDERKVARREKGE